MDFIDIIKRQRELYLKQLNEFYSTRSQGAREIHLEFNNEETERIFKLYRLDHFEQVEGVNKPTELAANRYLYFEKTAFILDSLSIELNPFYWHACDFVFDEELADINWLKLWATKWIDVEGKNPFDSNGYSGVIHNVIRPEQYVDGWQFSIDFGTASEEAFTELLHVIKQQEITRVRIGSFEMIS